MAMALALFILVNVFLAAHALEDGLEESREEAESLSGQEVRAVRSVSLSRPVRQAGGGNTCQRSFDRLSTDAEAGLQGSNLGDSDSESQPLNEVEAIDNSDIPGWGPGCYYGSGNCPTNRPLSRQEETRYYSELEWVMSEHVPGRM